MVTLRQGVKDVQGLKKTLVRQQSIVLVHFLISLNKLCILFHSFNCRFQHSRTHNAANQAIAMDSY